MSDKPISAIFTSWDNIQNFRDQIDKLAPRVRIGTDGYLRFGKLMIYFLNDHPDAVDAWGAAKITSVELQAASLENLDEGKDPDGDIE